MPPEACLIVEQLAAPFVELPELLRGLAADYKLDSYQCRQNLLGQGQALLTKGTEDNLREIQHSLAEYDLCSHVFVPTRLTFAPFVLTRIEINDETLLLAGREKRLIIPRGARLLLLLADLSRNLIERSLGQILSAQRYRGTSGESGLALEKQQRIILQGRPVLDIYLLDEQGLPVAAARAFPGKFDHHGLGERATLSATQNLLKLSELAQDYADQSRTDMSFGISTFPGADLQPVREGDLEGLKKNLRNLTRYAWLQADIDRQRALSTTLPSNELAAASAAVLAAIKPEMAAVLPVAQQVFGEVAKATAEEIPTERRSKRTPVTKSSPLPAPPDLQRHNVLMSPKSLIGITLAATIAIIAHLGQSSRWLAPLLKKSFSSGSITGLLALGLFFFAFRRLKLKRLIENTPTSKIRSVAMGIVEIKGTARRQYALVSPKTNIACIYYRLTRYKRNNKNNWAVSSITSSGQVPFWVEDETGRVSVAPDRADVKPGHRQESFEEGGSSFGGFSSPDEKWIEELIYDGALVYVLGEAQVKKSKKPQRGERRAEALRRLKQDRQKLAQYDVNNDGQIDEEEWQKARDEVDEQLLSEDLAASNERRRQEDQVIITRPRQRGLPFVVAETPSETSLSRGYSLSMGVMFSVGILAVLLTAWLLLQHR